MTDDGFKVTISDAMIEGMIEYADHIAAIKSRLNKPSPIVDLTEVEVGKIKGEEAEVWGTVDKLIYQKGNELHVLDYKFGKGVVEVVENNIIKV